MVGVGAELDARFSKRHEEIDAKTKVLLEREPAKAVANLAEIRENIAHNERSRKIKDIGARELSALWSGQLSAEEASALASVTQAAQGVSGGRILGNVESAVTWAEEHLFDRKSVVQEHELWRHALEHARGQDIECETVREATRNRPYVRGAANRRKVTTKDVLRREWTILELAKHGRGEFAALNARHPLGDSALDAEQRKAVEMILMSRDFLTLFRGGAGTGKSFALREVGKGIEAAGLTVVVVAPQRQQVMDLMRDGFPNVQTVSEFLTRKKLRRASVVIVDEAGQLGAKQMLELLSFIRESDGRVIASGDTRQHGAVEASDALRAIERYGGLRAAELTTVRRQDPDRAADPTEREFIEQYRRAVKEAAAGRMEDSFDRLDEHGAIVSCSLADQQAKLTADFLRIASGGHSSVVVAQTWSEIHKVNTAIRDALKASGYLGPLETTVSALERVDLTSAQKRDARFYQPGTIVVLNRDCGRFRKGQSGKFVGVTRNGIVLQVEDRIATITMNRVDRLTLCRRHDLALSEGDRLQLKANARTGDGSPLANGELVTVAKVEKDGHIILKDGRTLAANYRQFVRGYAVTSYASQGKTVDYGNLY